jgi:hypothetical protein
MFPSILPQSLKYLRGAGVIGSLDFYLDDIPNRIDQPIFLNGLGIAPGI